MIACGAPPDSPPLGPGDLWDDALVPTTGSTGWTDGAWSVEDDGSSSYHVPVWVPPGRNGLQPDISLTYNSRAGNGLAGFGWQLGGLSSITPCARTVLSDGEHETETPGFEDDDRLCLDGRHLTAVEPGTLGGGDFRVFRDGLTRVDWVDDSRSGFRAYFADGRIATYGVTPDALVVGRAVTYGEAGSEVGTRDVTIAWLISRLEDRFSNAIEYHYGTRLDSVPISTGLSVAAAEWWPESITYTHHDSLPARRAVRFRYEHAGPEARPDTTYEFIRGVAVSRRRRLTAIELVAPRRPDAAPARVREFRIAYQNSPVTDRSLIESIRECDAAGVCRAPIDLRWSRIDPLVVEARGPAYAQETARVFFPELVQERGTAVSGDFFGVGREYGLRRASSGWLISGQIASGAWETIGVPLPNASSLVPIDIDGNGRVELLRYYATDDGLTLGLQLLSLSHGSSGVQVNILSELAPPCGTGPSRAPLFVPAVADMDGDGLMDLVHKCSRYRDWDWMRRVRGTGVAFESARPIRGVSSPDINLIDINGDGRTDMVTPTGDAAVLLRGAVDFTVLRRRAPARGFGARVTYFDINDDGLADHLTIEDDANIHVRLNTGNGFAPGYLAASQDDLGSEFHDVNGLPCEYSPLQPPDLRTVDYDGDGRDDLVAFQDSVAPFDQRWPEGTNVLDQWPNYSPAPSPIPPGRRVHQGCEPRTIVFRSNGRDLAPELPLENVRPADGGAAYTYYLRPGTSARYVHEYYIARGAFQCVTRDGPPNPSSCSRTWPSVHLLRRGDSIVMLSETDAAELRAQHRFKVDEFHSVAPDLLSAVRRGGEVDVQFSYAARHFDSLTCDTERCGGTVRVVASHTDELGARFEHDYAWPRTATNGEGWLGFVWHQVRDESASRILSRYHDMTEEEGAGHAYAAQVQREIVWVRDTAFRTSLYWETQTSREVTPLATGGFFVPVTSSEHATWEVPSIPVCTDRPCLTEVLGPISGRAPLTISTRDTSYGPAGAIERETEWTDGVELRTTTVTAYDERPEAWQFGLPTELVTRVESPSGRNAAFRTRYRYTDEGSVWQILQDLQTTTVRRASSGLVEQVITEGVDGEVRDARFVPDAAEGMFAEQQINGLEHTTSTVYLPSTGDPIFEVNAGGIETRYSYDALGRMRRRTNRGIDELLEYVVGPSVTVPVALGTEGIRVTAPGGVDVVRYRDRFNRFHQRVHRGWSGNVVESVEYDEHGRPWAHHTAHYEGASHRVERVTYDNADRARFVLSGAPGEWSFTDYDGLTETTHTPSGIVAVLTHDGAGRVVQSRQPAGDDEGETVLTYSYGPGGVLETITDQRANRWRTEFDAHLRAIGTYNPDSGWSCVRRNALGEVTHDLDGSEGEKSPCSESAGPVSNAIAEYRRDAMGRVTEVLHRTDGRTEFVWDVTADGLLDHATRHQDGVTTAYAYDANHRLSSVTTTLDDRAFQFDYDYDEAGRLRDLTYPETAAGRFVVRHEYDDARGGALKRLLDVGGARSIWEAQGADAVGRVTRARQGTHLDRTVTLDGVNDRIARIQTTSLRGSAVQDERLDWSPEGDLRGRQDSVLGHQWIYEYDRRHRLTGYGDGAINHRYDYDDRGNPILFDNVAQRFEGRAHRLTGRGAVTSGFAQYDPDGRRTSTMGGIQVTQYNQFDLPVDVLAGGPNGPHAHYRYDAHGERVQRTSPAGTEVTIGPFSQSSEGRSWMQIRAAGEVVAEAVADGLTVQMLFVVNDHLGSPVAVVDEVGAITERHEYGPFGDRRRLEPDGTPDLTRAAAVSTGFTGHDQEEQFGVIDMGGRFFEPATGQFLTRDPMVASMLDRDSLNSYTYVRSNPLRFVDPSGFNLYPSESGSPGGSAPLPPPYEGSNPFPGSPAGPGGGERGWYPNGGYGTVDSPPVRTYRQNNETRVGAGGVGRVGRAQHGGDFGSLILPVQTGLPAITPGRDAHADPWYSRTVLARAEALEALADARALLDRARPGSANPLSVGERNRLATAMRDWFGRDITPESITQLQTRLQDAEDRLRTMPIRIIRSEDDIRRLPRRERQAMQRFFEERTDDPRVNAQALPDYIAVGPRAYEHPYSTSLASILIHEADHYRQPPDTPNDAAHPTGNPDMNPYALQGFLADAVPMELSDRYRRHVVRRGRGRRE